MNTANTYWGNQGRYQAMYDNLWLKVPAQGPVTDVDPRRKKLEKLRRAAGAYYDMFNNGGGNRAPEIRKIFGIGVRTLTNKNTRQIDFDRAVKLFDPIIDKLILDAEKERIALDG